VKKINNRNFCKKRQQAAGEGPGKIAALLAGVVYKFAGGCKIDFRCAFPGPSAFSCAVKTMKYYCSFARCVGSGG